MEKRIDILHSLFFILSIIIGLYPIAMGLNPEWKVAGAILFGLGIWSYLHFLFKEWVTIQVLGSKKMESILNKFEKRNQKINEEIIYIRGWIDAVNHFKNKKGFVDPITLIVIIIVLILIILILKGKI